LPIVLSALGDEQRTVTVRDAHSDEVVAMLLDDVIDVGFVLPGARPQPLRYVALEADPVIAVCAPDHPLAGRSVPLSGLAEHRLALNRWGAGAEAFIRRMEEIGLPERRRTECTDGHTALGLARDHHHVALLTASIASPALTAGQVTAVTLRGAPRWTVPLAFAYHGRVHNDPLIATIRSVIAARVHAEGRTARARPITR
jgi:DNA-binding transcriptional LysR family regulator